MAQLTTTLVTGPLTMVPVPPLTLQVCTGVVGLVFIETANLAPLGTLVGKVKLPFWFTATVSVTPPATASARTTPPVDAAASPTRVPPTGYEFVAQVTCTPVTFAVAVPVPPLTVHTCVGLDGCA